jgi:hypothetical protein
MITIGSLHKFLTNAFTFYMGGGGGGGQTSTQTGTTYTSNVPEYAKPYYEELLKQTGKETFQTDASGTVTGIKPYTPYTGERVAAFNPQQTNLQNQYANMQTPTGFADAQAGANYGQNLGFGAASSGISRALSYNPTDYTNQQVYAPNLQNYQMAGPANVGSQIFSQGAADYYSSPYQQNVTNAALREAQQKGTLDKNALMGNAISRGTFGGARNALLQAEQNRGLNTQMADIQNQGSQQGYLNAQQQFQADQARAQQAALANQQAGLTTGQQNLQANLQTQALGSGQNMTAQQLNQAAALQANQQNQQAQQYAAGMGKDVGLAGLNAGLDASKTQGALAAAQQTADLERLKAQSTSAAEQQAYQQKIDDLAYQTQMEQQDWQKKQLEFYSNILHGTSGALGSTQVNYTPQGSPLSQLAGAGVAGLSAYNLMK